MAYSEVNFTQTPQPWYFFICDIFDKNCWILHHPWMLLTEISRFFFRIFYWSSPPPEMMLEDEKTWFWHFWICKRGELKIPSQRNGSNMTQMVGLTERNAWNYFQNFFSKLFSNNGVWSGKNTIQTSRNVFKHAILTVSVNGIRGIIAVTIDSTEGNI